MKGLLSISWNQRDKKEKQTVLGLASVKFRQSIENRFWKKNSRKGKGCEDFSIRVPANKQTKKSKQIKYVTFKQRTRNIISTMNTTYYESYDASVRGDKSISGK